MRYKGHVVWLSQGRICFSDKVATFSVAQFVSALEKIQNGNDDKVVLDFRFVERAYPNGMLPIIALTNDLSQKGFVVEVLLPEKQNPRSLFLASNWAHLLCPTQYRPSESVHNRHLVSQYFTNAVEQKSTVDKFMDVVLRNMEIKRSSIAGLEWSINEITDNVLNHAEARLGGIVQASTYPSQQLIGFTVVDAGRGVLKSLREGYPSLRTDEQAIGEAIKAGVTRNSRFGQGNGLAGALRITNLSGGSFDISSGRSRFVITGNQTKRYNQYRNESFPGTIVGGQINTASNFALSEALSFGTSHPYQSVDIIENQYELEDERCLAIRLQNETTGFGSRHSGKQLRQKAENLLAAEPTYPLILDWSGVPVISSSFADEFIGKLFLSMGAITFSARIRNRNMEPLIVGLLDKAIAQRLTQEVDP